MTRKAKLFGTFGIALVVTGLFGPWLQFTLGGVSGTSGVPGGTLLLLAFGLVGAAAALARGARVAVIPFALVAAAWIVVKIYESPGTALENSGTGGMVEVAWGALVALLGCAVIYASAWFPRPRSGAAAAADEGASHPA